jgi:hypothetical protein
MHRQIWEQEVEDELPLGVRKQKKLNATLVDVFQRSGRAYSKHSALNMDAINSSEALNAGRETPGNVCLRKSPVTYLR